MRVVVPAHPVDSYLTVLAWQPADATSATPTSSHAVRLSVPLATRADDGVEASGLRTAFALRRRVDESLGYAPTETSR